MNKQDFLKTQSCVLRVNIHCYGCRSEVKKILQKIDGVYTINIDAEKGKVTVTGTVDPSVLIKKLEKNGKHAELWGPPSSNSKGSNQNNQFMNLNNQFSNFNFDGGKMGKDDNNNNKSQKGGKDQQKGGGQQQQHQQLLQRQIKDAKDFKMPSKDPKTVKFNLPEDEFDDDDEFDDEFDSEYDDELDDDMYEGHAHHPPSKNIPIMGNGQAGKGGGSGGGEKKAKGGGGDKRGKEGGGGKAVKGGGGGVAALFKGMLGGGGKSDSKKGKVGEKDGKNGGKGKEGGDGKNGVEGKIGKEGNHKGGSIKGGYNGNNGNGKSNGNGNGNGVKKGGGGGGASFNDIDGINHGKSGGPNMSMMGHMGNYPMGLMGQPMPAASGQPATAPHMINAAGGGYYQGMGPPGPYNNPQQQQYMAMMMNQQRMNGGDGYGGMYQPQPMMYGRPPMGVGYAPAMVPTPVYHDPLTSYFSDENTNSCSIM